MKNGSWEECMDNNDAIKVSPDKAKARSLIETSKDRVNFLKRNEVNEMNARFVFEGYYSSTVEMIHALITLNGFKVDNHICLGYYLSDVLKREDLFRIFDDCRYKRNSIVYYGRKIDFDIAKESINKILRLLGEVNLIVDEILRQQ